MAGRADRFRSARVDKGLTLAAVERETYISKGTINAIENDAEEKTNPTFNVAYSLAKMYGVNVVWLMTGEGEP